MLSQSNLTSLNLDDERIIMILINVSVLVLGTIGIIVNGFSLFVIWKCINTGQLAIKLVLLSDMIVCITYVASNIQSNIVNNLSDQLEHNHIVKLATINRLSIHVALFVSNWWIISLLLLRVLTIFLPLSVKAWDKMLNHWIMYGVCWVTGVVLVVPLRFQERYMRLVIYVIPVILVSIEAGLIICGIRRVQSPRVTQRTKCPCESYHEIPSSSSNSYNCTRTPQKLHSGLKTSNKPYNNIVLTILLLALNYLILDSLLFIDTIHVFLRFPVEDLPSWFMLLINIFSLMKRILNFVILCAKCRHFRRIMTVKLSLLTRKVILCCKPLDSRCRESCRESKEPILYARGNEFLLQSDVIGCHLNEEVNPKEKRPLYQISRDSFDINSYYSAFEMLPFMSHMSTFQKRLILSSVK